MPASLRAHTSRGMASSSRPYDRRSPTASPAQSTNPLAHPYLSRGQPPTPLVQDPDPDAVDPDTPPDHPGLPTYAEYKRIEAGYLHGLSPRKRDKALITQTMFDKIWDVLHQPDACTIETPQFRFWVRKMFSLSRPMYVGVQGDASWGGTYPDLDSDSSDADGAGLELERAMGIEADMSADLFSAVVLHENRPVAIMEQLYELFCYCHVRARHGGRDKTCAVIRQHYSWVPKELTAQFVKACPTCALKRSGHGGVSVDMGFLVQRRVVGQRERRVYGTPLRGEEIPGSVVPSSLGSMGWPMTGGPLDPANPEPCGVRERERERAWVRVHEDARTIDPPSLPVSPARASVDASSRMRTVPREVALESCLSSGWNSVLQTLTTDTSPFRSSAVGVTGNIPQPFAVRAWTRSDRGEKHSPTRTGLPSLASALSNESLDENVNLTGLGPETAGECLPSVLRPLRLLGPMIPESDLRPPPSESHLFQIDPVLLSFNYPGLGLSESGSASFGADSAMPLALSCKSMSSEALFHRGGSSHRDHGGNTMYHGNGGGLCRLLRRAPSDGVDADGLNTMMPSSDERDAPDEHDAVAYSTTLPRARSGRRRRGSRHGPLATLYQCSTDEVGQQLDGTISFRS